MCVCDRVGRGGLPAKKDETKGGVTRSHAQKKTCYRGDILALCSRDLWSLVVTTLIFNRPVTSVADK